MGFDAIIPGAGGLVGTGLAFVAALLLIVAVHEFGHYIIGRLCGIRAQVFSLGFGKPLISRVDRHGTRWQIAWVPLGGYVRFLGDVDGTSVQPDGSTLAGLSPEELRATMHGAPLWARSATVAAGPLFNFALTILIFSGSLWWSGVPRDEPIIGTLHAMPFEGQGLQPGDRILAVGGVETPDLETFYTVADKVPPQPSVTYRVERAGQTADVAGPHPLPPVVNAVQPQSAALDAGLQAGDVVLTVAGQPVAAFAEMPALVEAAAGQPVALTIWRDGKTFDVSLTPRRRDLPTADGGFETRWLIGLSGGLLFEPEMRTPGVVESVKIAAEQSWFLARTNLSGIAHMFTGAISTCNISGPITMAQVMGEAARSGFETFLQMAAVLSLGIGLFNLFPIPVLDGGHLVLHLWEGVTGQAPNRRVLQGLTMLGLLILLALMALALTNDLTCT